MFCKILTEYNPPEPPKGTTHRYLQAVFQHEEPLNVEGINQRCAFDIDLFTLTTVGILTRINGMCAIRREQQQASLYECTSCKT